MSHMGYNVGRNYLFNSTLINKIVSVYCSHKQRNIIHNIHYRPFLNY